MSYNLLRHKRCNFKIEYNLDIRGLQFESINFDDYKRIRKNDEAACRKVYPKNGGEIVRIERLYTSNVHPEIRNILKKKKMADIVTALQSLNGNGNKLTKDFMQLINGKIKQGFLTELGISKSFGFKWELPAGKKKNNGTRILQPQLSALLNKCSYYDLSKETHEFVQNSIKIMPSRII